MSSAEVAIAHSHIGIWRTVAEADASYALVLEDDVWFSNDFGKVVDLAWEELGGLNQTNNFFDILYVSFKEARHGAPKELISRNLFRPDRGLWFLSGYVLSKAGAQALLALLPCRGPVDLWINHRFGQLKVRAIRKPMVFQRSDIPSTNSYSILPVLSRLGVLDYSDAAFFHQRPSLFPVIAFGTQQSGLSSLAMALSMLGYTCCSDLDAIPDFELQGLLTGKPDRLFNAYVNIGILEEKVATILRHFPRTKFIFVRDPAIPQASLDDKFGGTLRAVDVLRLDAGTSTWTLLCNYLRLSPPSSPYPSMPECGQRRMKRSMSAIGTSSSTLLKCDPSPWTIKRSMHWCGISTHEVAPTTEKLAHVTFEDDFSDIQPSRWLLRNDTFPGNLALFRPANVSTRRDGGLSLFVTQEALEIRSLSAGAISSRASFRYGRFEVRLQAANVPGIVTGFFLHRNSPRQEIDIEIAGNDPRRLLINVFYNPGEEGAKYDYGYRGTPVAIPLDFDASESAHCFSIEWDPCEIRWAVDGKVVHRRNEWNPTPIPRLPMTLHVNTWPTRSRELAGRLRLKELPASATVRKVAVYSIEIEPRLG